MDVVGRKPSRRIVNTFGAIGYSLLLSCYAIIAGVGMLWLVQGGHLTPIGVPPEAVTVPAEAETSTVAPTEPSIIVTIFAYIITAFMMVTVIFVVITLPYWLGRSGSYILKHVIRFFRYQVTSTTLLVGKLIACAVAALPVLLFITQDTQNLIVSLTILAVIGLSLATFLVQHYLAKMSGIEVEETW